MDALVYEDHPLATYFEGDAVPCELSRASTPPQTPFAPQGLPDFTTRLRTIRQSGLSITPTSTEQLLERFRYVIVASQLLSDETSPQAAASEDDTSQFGSFTIQGTVITAILSFLAAWTLHWARTRSHRYQANSWLDIGICFGGVLMVGVGMAVLAEQQYAKHVQKSTIRSLSKFISHSHDFDTTASNTIRFIQEVEIVARGYELSLPLPPISRIEGRSAVRRCRALRSELATALRLLTVLMVESHDAVQPYISSIDLQRYHDIYEVSLVEYSQAVELANTVTNEGPNLLKDIRLSLHLHSIARRVFLCDLLALKPTTGLAGLKQWRNVHQILGELEAETFSRQQALFDSLSFEEWGDAKNPKNDLNSDNAASQVDNDTSANIYNLKNRTRRFDEISQSIRALNAKVHFLREETLGSNISGTDDMMLASTLSQNYEALGADIKNLLIDWERGRNTMLFNGEHDVSSSGRYSRGSSSVRSPLSGSPSLGGTTVVDGGPAEALRLLMGDVELDNNDLLSPTKKPKDLDEQVFEAVAVKPIRKRMSIAGLTREEKMMKLQEDRKKRATMQEHADNNTNMLRELRMVIKHRPRASISPPSQRVSSI